MKANKKHLSPNIIHFFVMTFNNQVNNANLFLSTKSTNNYNQSTLFGHSNITIE